MVSKTFNLGSDVTVKSRDGKSVKGTVYNYVKYLASGNPALYQVKLNSGGVIVVWPEELLESAEK